SIADASSCASAGPSVFVELIGRDVVVAASAEANANPLSCATSTVSAAIANTTPTAICRNRRDVRARLGRDLPRITGL
ncbi:hypothetical protein ACWEPR_37405, partial [Streptomyces sp. NPDC004290]